MTKFTSNNKFLAVTATAIALLSVITINNTNGVNAN